MKIKGKISLGRVHSNKGPSDYVTITLRDDDARIGFAEVTLTLEQFALVMTGLSCVDCEIEVGGLEHVGKVVEHKEHVFKIPKNVEHGMRRKTAAQIANKTCPKGWTPDTYFGSQESFFVKEGQTMARCIIRRWVPKPEGEPT